MSYTYTPLRTDSQEIRVVYLDPCRPRRNCSGREAPPIRLRIETVTLHDAGEYTCLSYTWGGREPRHTIQVDGHDFDVRADLFTALRRLRLPDRPRRLWIDAICINQDDIPERDSQVAMMRHIFHNATDVIAWIGEDNGSQDQRAVDFVRALSTRAQGLITQKKGSSKMIDAETAAWIGSITPWAFVGSVWMDFISLIERPWFSRIWIVQEIVMARNTTVWCGRHQLDWMKFLYCSLFVKRHRSLIASLAAPDCLPYHDPGKQDIFFENKPHNRLFKAAENIVAIGQLVGTRQMGMIFKGIIGEGWAASDLFPNKRPSDAVWAEFNTASREIRLYFSKPLDGWSAAADQGEGACGTLFPRVPCQKTKAWAVNQPNMLRTLLHHPPGGRALLAVTTDGIPIFDATSADVDTKAFLAGAQISQQPEGVAYKFSKPIAISGDEISKRSGLTMYDIVHRFRTFQATDARVKVYALVGVASEVALALGSFPRISYADNISILDVFWDLIDSELRYGRGLGILNNACGANRPEGVPSWKPLWYDDISDKSSTPCGLRDLEGLRLTRYYADDDYADHGNAQPAYLDKAEGMLYVHAILQSEIAFLGDMFDRDLAEHDRLNMRLKWATMLGVERLDKALQVLTKLRRVGMLSAEDVSERFSAFATRHAVAEVMERQNSFLGTLRASASDAGTQHLVNQPPKNDPGITANVMGQCSAVRDTDCDFEDRSLEVCHGRRLFICGRGRHAAHGHVPPNFGLCPANAQAGDLVVVLYGSSTPQVVRKIGEDEEGNIYEFVGEAYVHTWMLGQMMPKEATRPYKFKLR